MKIFFISLLLVTLFGFSYYWFFPATFDCENSVKQEVRSPTGDYFVIWYERDCGATTDFSTIIRISPTDAKRNEDKFEDIFIIKGQEFVDIQWKDDSHMVIKYFNDSEIFKQITFWKGINISFISVAR